MHQFVNQLSILVEDLLILLYNFLFIYFLFQLYHYNHSSKGNYLFIYFYLYIQCMNLTKNKQNTKHCKSSISLQRDHYNIHQDNQQSILCLAQSFHPNNFNNSLLFHLSIFHTPKRNFNRNYQYYFYKTNLDNHKCTFTL